MEQKKIQIKCFCLGEFDTNCYILWGVNKGKCILIDPADDGERIQKELDALNVVPEAVFLTHGHFDHILAVPYLQKQWPLLPVYCHRLDCPAELQERYMGVKYPTVSAFANLIYYGGQEAETIAIGGLVLQVLHMPGHTPGSVVIQVNEALFTGDTLFKGSIGRTDFEGGDQAAMMQSLAKLMKLPGDYIVFPGHDETTTLQEEKKYNPYCKFVQSRLL